MMRLPDIRPCKKEMLKIIVNELRKDKYPFEAEHDRDRLVIRWKKNWAQRRRKDLNRIDIRSMTNEIRDFRYVVYLNDDHTFYGYDTNSLALAKGDINTQGSFTGTEIRLHKEIIHDKNGKKVLQFSTSEIHEMITKIFDEQGWELKQPLISFITVERNAGAMFLGTGLVLMFAGVFITMVFLLIGLGLPLLIPVLTLLIGLWLFLTGNGIFKFPVFSIKGGLIFTGVFYTAVYLALFIFLSVL